MTPRYTNEDLLDALRAFTDETAASCTWCGEIAHQSVDDEAFCSWRCYRVSLNQPCEPFRASIEAPKASLDMTVRTLGQRQVVHWFIRECGSGTFA